jgi:hypothetical protein
MKKSFRNRLEQNGTCPDLKWDMSRFTALRASAAVPPPLNRQAEG